MKVLVLSHGDCDGVIAAALYIRHFLIDLYPSNIMIGFTQPWRASKEIKRFCRDFCEKIILLDIAIDEEVFSAIANSIGKGSEIHIIDHHTTTGQWVNKLRDLGVNILWSRSTSTPRLIKETLKITLNPYEENLVEIADACEGSETRGSDIKNLADLLKLAISRDPSDIGFLTNLLNTMLRGGRIEELEELRSKAKAGRMLVDNLLDKIASRGEVIGDFILFYLQPAESRIYAGLFGIACTEASKKFNKDVVILREEDSKIVVTVRSLSDKALSICKEIVSRTSSGKYGGHKEAASATILGYSLKDTIDIVREILWSMTRKKESTEQ
ncbi:MAG: hypothetical protein QXD76_02425 [Sulfolobales archaeon]